jgi:ribonuclease HI
VLWTLEKDVKHIQIFGDSSLVINWMQGSSQIYNVQLKPIAEQLMEMSRAFEQFTFPHIYREHNEEADTLSKEGQGLAKGSMILVEARDGVPISSMLFL